MKVESYIKPNKFYIENLGNGKSTVFFYDNIKQLENEENSVKYVYDFYKIEIYNRDNLAEEIEQKFESWLEFAKDCEYEQLAADVRNKRNKLLEETDKEMCLDRLGLKTPEGNSFSSWINFLKTISNALTGEYSRYRQELRDITKQPGFPYEVIFPKKPNESEE